MHIKQVINMANCRKSTLLLSLILLCFPCQAVGWMMIVVCLYYVTYECDQSINFKEVAVNEVSEAVTHLICFNGLQVMEEDAPLPLTV
mgnify:CR=1 FL=1